MTKNIWMLDSSKFLSEEEVFKLLQVVRFEQRGKRKVAIRDGFIVHLALATGLRVMEIAALKCGDLYLDKSPYSLLVRKGKGKKQRMVIFNLRFQQACTDFLNWKQHVGEPIAPDQPLLRSSITGSHLTTRSLQKSVKRLLKKAGLPTTYSIHSLRHTYACLLLKASNWNLRLVQKQLGHSKITTTQAYADIMKPDIIMAVNDMCI